MIKFFTSSRRLPAILFLLFHVSAAFSRPDSVSYDILHFTSDNGLPQNSVKSIARDKHGFIWMATEGGLVRFDGQHFRIFNKQELPIASSRMRYLVRGRKTGSLYGVTELRRLIRIRNADATLLPKYIKAYSSFTIAPDSKITAFHVLAPNLYKTDIPPETPHQLSVTPDLSFLISRDTVRLYNKKNEQWKAAFPFESSWFFFLFEKQLFYLENDGSVTLIRKDSLNNFLLEGDIRQNRVYRRKQPTLYWNTTSGDVFLYLNQCLYILEHRSDGAPFTRLLLSGFDAARNSISSVYYDRGNDRLFMGSLTKGLFVARRKFFTTLTTQGGDETYYAQLAYKGNASLTYKGRLLGIGKTAAYLPLVDRYSDNYSMLTDTAENIWQKKSNSVYQLSPEGDRLLSQYTLPDRVSSLFMGLDNRLWIGTEKNGIYLLAPGEKGPRHFMPFREAVSYFAQKREDTLWVGTKSGLYRVSLKERKADTVEGLDSLYIRSIYIPGPGEIWITTEGSGFYLYKGGRLTHFPMDRNGYLAEAHCILEDDNGYFWISTNRGLFQASKKDLLEYVDKRREDIFYMYYGKEAGFNTNEFNGGCQPCGIKLENGYFSFPSLNGLVWFEPAEMQAELPRNGIYINEVEVDNVLLSADDTLHLPSRFNRMQVRFTSPYFGNPYNLSFKYKLEGPDRQAKWLDATSKSAISFSSMSSGIYRLTIRRQSGFGIVDDIETHLVIVIPPLFYETWWFKAFVVLAALLLVFVYIRSRLKGVRTKNAELEKKIAERTLKLKQTILAQKASEERMRQQNYLQQRLLASITHDIKSPLQYLALTSKTMYESYREKNGIIRDDLERIYKSSHRLFHFTENLVHYMKANMAGNRLSNEQVYLFELINKKIEIFSDLAASKGNIIENGVDRSIAIRTNRQLLGIVIHNLLDNAIKFTRSGRIQFSDQHSGSATKLVLEDTGLGMDEETIAWCNNFDPARIFKGPGHLPQGLGLTIVLELLVMIDGNLLVTRKPGGGTRIELIL